MVLSFSTGLNTGSAVNVYTPKSDKGTVTEPPLLSVKTKSSPTTSKVSLKMFSSQRLTHTSPS